MSTFYIQVCETELRKQIRQYFSGSSIVRVKIFKALKLITILFSSYLISHALGVLGGLESYQL